MEFIEKCKLILNRWLQSDITIFERVLLSKMDSLFRLIYPAVSLPISTNMIKAINKINFNFIWRNKCQNIRKIDMVKNYEDGGAKAIENGWYRFSAAMRFWMQFVTSQTFCFPSAGPSLLEVNLQTLHLIILQFGIIDTYW